MIPLLHFKIVSFSMFNWLRFTHLFPQPELNAAIVKHDSTEDELGLIQKIFIARLYIAGIFSL